jgi:hypothetical protein
MNSQKLKFIKFNENFCSFMKERAKRYRDPVSGILDLASSIS